MKYSNFQEHSLFACSILKEIAAIAWDVVTFVKQLTL